MSDRSTEVHTMNIKTDDYINNQKIVPSSMNFFCHSRETSLGFVCFHDRKQKVTFRDQDSYLPLHKIGTYLDYFVLIFTSLTLILSNSCQLTLWSYGSENFGLLCFFCLQDSHREMLALQWENSTAMTSVRRPSPGLKRST